MALTCLVLLVAFSTRGCGGDGAPPDADIEDAETTDADGDADSDGDTDGDLDADTDLDTDADGDGDADADGDEDSDDDADPETDVDADGDGDRDADNDGDEDEDLDGDGDTDLDADTDADEDDGDVGAEECPEPGGGALSFDGVDDHVAVDHSADLGLVAFTLEAWVRWDGSGVATRSGSDSVSIIPVIAKGRTEADGSPTDCNYLFGIHDETHALAADFEDIATGASHPVVGSTPLEPDVWHHAAVTYDGTTWNLYLDGEPDGDLAAEATPRHDSSHHVGLGTAFNSSGTPAGAFGGALDEVRIWDRARTPAEIVDGLGGGVIAMAGLVARWALDEEAGDVAADSAGAHPGAVVGAAWIAEGALFTVGSPPSITLVAPADGESVAAGDVDLTVRIDDDHEHAVTVEIWGRPIDPDFTIVVLPDTQFYASDYPETFMGQTRWIRDHAAEYNVRAVLHVGDLVDDPRDEEQWINADAAMAVLEEPGPGYPDGIPYGLAVGNHDQYYGSTSMFNEYFGADRFAGRPWYGGHYGSYNDNHYIVFEAGSTRFVAAFVEWNVPDDEPVLEWVHEVMLDHPDRRALFTMHYIVGLGDPAPWSVDGLAAYETLRDVPTLDLMFCGHIYGEARRSDTVEGHTIHTMLADYQDLEHGGNGWLRLLFFSPASGTVHVRTWSTYLEEWQIDDDSDFELPYEVAAPPFERIAERSRVRPGTEVTATWRGLEPGRTYQWRATAESCWFERSSEAWSFLTH